MTKAKPSEIEAIDAALRDAIGRVRTFATGNVVTYQPPSPAGPARCTVQLARRIADTQGRPAVVPPVPNIPIAFFGSGVAMVWSDLVPGDEVLLGVPDRSIGDWLLKNGQVDPRDQRQFDVAGAVAFPVCMTATKGGIPGSGFLNIGRRDGSVLMQVSTTGPPLIRLGTEASVSPVALAPELATVLADSIAAALTAVVPNDGGAAALTRLGVELAAAAADYAATKVVAE